MIARCESHTKVLMVSEVDPLHKLLILDTLRNGITRGLDKQIFIDQSLSWVIQNL